MRAIVTLTNFAFITGLFIGSVLLPRSAIAQVVPDGTLPTIVTSIGNSFTIEGGARSGTNLFHSFSQFSVPTGGAAIFNNAIDIQNIFSRVTGGVGSTIDGVIQANGTANLFLLNPNGILFGPNASLNIGGSFIGTTADSIKFADGVEFSVVNANGSPLLTMSVPIGLQMGQNPGAITLSNAQLEVTSGKTLALIGGDITQTGGTLRISGDSGRIELAGVGDNGTAKLQPAIGGWMIDTTDTPRLKNVTIRDGARILGHGFNSSSIRITGDNIVAQNDTRINSFNSGDQLGGDIILTASNAIQLMNSSLDLEAQSSGNAGNIRLTAPTIDFIRGGFGIKVNANATGHGGDALITTDVLQMLDSAGYSNATYGYGNGGDIIVNAHKMIVARSSGGAPLTFGVGNAGNLNISVDELSIENRGGFGAGSYLPTPNNSGLTGGNGGDINIVANSIILRNRVGINSDTQTSGHGGNINIKANYIELDTGHFNARTSGTGTAGNINITTETLRLLNGGQMGVTTRGPGKGGNININAQKIELNGEPTRGALTTESTGFFSSILPNQNQSTPPTGNGGNINLISSSLVIRDGALISASASSGTGNGGNINLQIDRLDAFNGGQIVNSTRTTGDAGTITIQARDRISLSGSDAVHTQRQEAFRFTTQNWTIEKNVSPFSGIYGDTTPSSAGNGGIIELTTNTLEVQAGATINVNSQGKGNAGNLSINANTVRLNQQGSLQAESVSGNQGNLFLNVDQVLLLRQGSTITTNAIGTANGGNITINAPIILGLENSDIIANAIQGRGGNIDITTQGLIGLKFRNTLTPRTDLTNDITASSQFNINGTVQVSNVGVDPNAGLVNLPVELVDPSQQIAQSCVTPQSSSFVISGRGGIHENPINQFTLNHPWADLRHLTPDHRHPVTAMPSALLPNPPLVEAVGWRRNRTGQMELFAAAQPTSVPTALPVTCTGGQ